MYCNVLHTQIHYDPSQHQANGHCALLTGESQSSPGGRISNKWAVQITSASPFCPRSPDLRDDVV